MLIETSCNSAIPTDCDANLQAMIDDTMTSWFKWTGATERAAVKRGTLEFSDTATSTGINWNDGSQDEWQMLRVDSSMDADQDLGIWNAQGTAGSQEQVVNFDAAFASASTHTVGTTLVGRATTFFTGVFVDWINQERRSDGFTDIATALTDLPSTDGLLRIDSDENDTTAFVDTNPATASAGKQDALVVDTRDGKFRVLSSADQPHCGSGNNCTQDMVPFSFFVRMDDPTKAFSDSDADGTLDGGAIGEWNDQQDIGSCSTTTATKCNADGDCPGGEFCRTGTCSVTSSTECKTAAQCPAGESCVSGSDNSFEEYKNISTGHFVGGADASSDPSYMHGGMCNIGETFCSTTTATKCLVDGDCPGGETCIETQLTGCGGAAIAEFGYHTDSSTGQPGEALKHPSVVITTGGLNIHMPPETHTYYTSPFTIFRGQGNNWSPGLWNMPFFMITDDGVRSDGGGFFGNTKAWPAPLTSYIYPTFNLAAHHDVQSTDPAAAIFSSTNSGSGWEDGILFRIEDKTGINTRSGAKFWDYTFTGQEDVMTREAFGVYANSVVKLGSYAETLSGDVNEGQYIQWEGIEQDGATGGYTAITDGIQIRLGSQFPTSADKYIRVPDASGGLPVDRDGTETSTPITFECGSVSMDPPNVPTVSTATGTATVTGLAANDVCECAARADFNDDLIAKGDGCYGTTNTLNLRLYNPTGADINPTAQTVDYCCWRK
jgi:hypothetical protein